MSKCLYCHKELKAHEKDFHAHCSRTFFCDSVPPTLNYSHDEMDSLAAAIIQSQTTLTGVQPKILLHLNQHEGSKRLTVVGLWGGYIFKPQTELYPHLPELEDVTMHLAEESKLAVVPHSLIRLRDGELGYITRRIDRQADGTKIAMEDMCQLTERPTEYKYRSSHEQIAKAIRKFSSVPDLDVMQYYELVLFCYLTGNNDMHLKNFSIYQPNAGEYRLAPAYDLLNVAIVNPKDTEELALTLNGKKRRLTRHDFETAMLSSGLNEKVVSNIFRKFLRIYPQWEATIRNSFLPADLQEAYWQLIQQRITTLHNTTPCITSQSY